VSPQSVASFHGGLAPITRQKAGKVKARIASFTRRGGSVHSRAQGRCLPPGDGQAGVSYKAVTIGVQASFTIRMLTSPDRIQLPLAYQRGCGQGFVDEGLAFLADAFNKIIRMTT